MFPGATKQKVFFLSDLDMPVSMAAEEKEV